MARRSAVSKADAGDIGDEQMSDEKLKALQNTSIKDGGESEKKSDSDDDEDEDDDKKAPWQKGEDDDDDDDDEDETDKSKKSQADVQVERKLQKAVRHLLTLVKSTDPAMRKEALFAKSMNGAQLTDQEADELDALVRGRSLGEPLRERAAPQLTKSFKKAVTESSALTDLCKGVAGSHAALCDEIDVMKSSMDEIHCLLAKAIGAIGETVGSLHSGQGAIATALEKSLGQPAHSPRSVGVGYSERSFNGASQVDAPVQAEKALRDMSKSAPNLAAREAIAKALFQLQTTNKVSAPVQQMIKSHLAGA